MSSETFLRNGIGRLVLIFNSEAYRIPWPIRVYEIGEKSEVGVLYPDKAKQVQPRSWWAKRLENAPPLPPEEAEANAPEEPPRRVVQRREVKSPPPKKMTPEQQEERAKADYKAIVGEELPHIIKRRATK